MRESNVYTSDGEDGDDDSRHLGHKGVCSKWEITRQLQKGKKISSWNLNDKNKQ